MKKNLLIVFSITALLVFGILINTKNSSESEVDKLREQHVTFLDNSPFKETKKLSKKERKLNGLPPNKYMERQWELTMDPEDGAPHPERTLLLQQRLNEESARVPGENTNAWEERGPNNIGGRTRAIMYDPNDTNGTRVFAGGVSGGLWVNDDITNASSAWSEVGIPNNLAVSCITYDPNDTDIFYLGTGETYTGDASSNGAWQSTDGGITWNNIFGDVTGVTEFQANAKITVNTPAGISGEYPVILATAFGGQLLSAVTGDLVLAQDGTGDLDDACEALTNAGALAGKIAVIRRGDCPFVDKINRAQDAGAIGVIMVNNIGSDPIPMGGTDAGITIPNVMISRDLGNVIIAELGSGVNATMELSGNLLSGSIIAGARHINDIKVKDIGGGNSEVYIAAGSTGFYDSSPRTQFGMEEAGLYKSTDDGVSFTKLALGDAPSGLPINPNDIEISVDGTIWVSTVANRFFFDGGGLVFSSTDGGSTFVQKYVASGTADRTHIAVSGTNAGTLFAISYRGGGDASPVFIAKTADGFGRVSNMSQPNSIDTGIPDNDFTNTQGWYNIYIEVDPTDDNILYVGGIDAFRSGDGGLNWNQISEAYTNTSISDVHPDQHAIVFNPSDSNKAVFGNDGGIFYSDDLANAASSGTGLTSRNSNFNITQFYKGAIGQEVANEKLLAGAQDNNTLLLNNATAGINSADIVLGGDGAFCFIDRDNEYMVGSSQNGNFTKLNYTTGGGVATISSGSVGGQFITPAALDSDNDILYMDGTTGTPTYQILRYSNLDGTPSSGVALADALLVRNPTAFKTSTFTTTTLFVGTDDGKLLKLLNANATPTWSDISGPDFVGSVSCIELGASENDIYVTFYNYGVTSIFYSPDGGTTWSNKEGDLPDLPVRAILSNPLNADEVIVGTQLGVWGTANFNDVSPNWAQAQNGMKDVQVTSFDLRTADNTVLASTYGRGMFTGQFTAAPSGLSVDDFSENDLIKIYPTVSDGNITISPNSEIREGSIGVFDMNGRNVHLSNVNFESGVEQPVSLSLSSGMYIVKFSSEGLQSSHKIIIK